MSSTLPFRLKVSGTDEFRGLRAVSTSFSFHGFLRLERYLLTIEWAGVARVQDVGALSIRDDRLPLPDESITLPVSQLYSAKLIGGWLRPRLAIRARRVGALAAVPSEDQGIVQFWLTRSERAAGKEMATAISLAIASAPAAVDPPSFFPSPDEAATTPPGGLPNI